MYHAILYEKSLANDRVIKDYKVIKTVNEGNERLCILEFVDPDEFIQKIQKAMRTNAPYYFYIYDNGISMRIVFKDSIFRVNPNNKNTWISAQRYGKSLGIDHSRLDFYPTRIKEEEKWF